MTTLPDDTSLGGARRSSPSVELYWIPLGAGTPIVQWNGRAYETLMSRLQGRAPRDLYHSSLIVTADDGCFTIEMTPVPDRNGATRGVVAEGPVGLRLAGRLRIFRYEIRRWRGGIIPDLAWAVDSPRLVADDLGTAQRVLDLVPKVPTPVWGRDELSTGDMWNSNSVTSWLLTSSGVDVDALTLPVNGRAPGWDAGIIVARRWPVAAPLLGRGSVLVPTESGTSGITPGDTGRGGDPLAVEDRELSRPPARL